MSGTSRAKRRKEPQEIDGNPAKREAERILVQIRKVASGHGLTYESVSRKAKVPTTTVWRYLNCRGVVTYSPEVVSSLADAIAEMCSHVDAERRLRRGMRQYGKLGVE